VFGGIDSEQSGTFRSVFSIVFAEESLLAAGVGGRTVVFLTILSRNTRPYGRPFKNVSIPGGTTK